jgi:hypothetical protein
VLRAALVRASLRGMHLRGDTSPCPPRRVGLVAVAPMPSHAVATNATAQHHSPRRPVGRSPLRTRFNLPRRVATPRLPTASFASEVHRRLAVLYLHAIYQPVVREPHHRIALTALTRRGRNRTAPARSCCVCSEVLGCEHVDSQLVQLRAHLRVLYLQGCDRSTRAHGKVARTPVDRSDSRQCGCRELRLLASQRPRAAARCR